MTWAKWPEWGTATAPSPAPPDGSSRRYCPRCDAMTAWVLDGQTDPPLWRCQPCGLSHWTLLTDEEMHRALARYGR